MLPAGAARATYMPCVSDPANRQQRHPHGVRCASASRVDQDGQSGAASCRRGWASRLAAGRVDTLVVDVTGFNVRRGSIGQAVFTAKRPCLERFTPARPDRIDYRATIEDPKVFTRPWTIRMPLYRRHDENVQLLEFKCVEFVEEMMYGHLRKKTATKNRSAPHACGGRNRVCAMLRGLVGVAVGLLTAAVFFQASSSLLLLATDGSPWRRESQMPFGSLSDTSRLVSQPPSSADG